MRNCTGRAGAGDGLGSGFGAANDLVLVLSHKILPFALFLFFPAALRKVYRN